MSAPNFWDNPGQANKTMRELKYLKSCVEPFDQSTKRLEDIRELTALSKDDLEFLDHVQEELVHLEVEVNKLELQSIL